MREALLAAVLPFESSAVEERVKFAARISTMRQRMRVLNLLTWKQWNFFLRVKRCIAR